MSRPTIHTAVACGRSVGLTLVVLFAVGCGVELEASFNVDVLDFGEGGWVDGAPSDPKTLFLVNDGASEIYVHALRIEGPTADSWSVESVRSVEFPYVINSSVGSELTVSFSGVPDDRDEDFDVTLTADLTATAANRSRNITSASVPITLFLSCDLDGDGDLAVVCVGGDCDEYDPARSSEQPELCNGLDDDCNGLTDADPAGEVDDDFDGHRSCEDCADDDPFTYPGAPERCNGFDDDCNGETDYDAAGEVDADADGWLSCDDCDDSDPMVGPFGCD